METVKERVRLPTLSKSPSKYLGKESRNLLTKDHDKLIVLPTESQKQIKPPVVTVTEKAPKQSITLNKLVSDIKSNQDILEVMTQSPPQETNHQQ